MKVVSPPKERTHNERYRAHINAKVNIDCVFTINAAKEAYYPDNEGIPVIVFWFGGNETHKWYFDKGEESARDACLRSLAEEGKDDGHE